jgi:hypothetical protein
LNHTQVSECKYFLNIYMMNISDVTVFSMHEIDCVQHMNTLGINKIVEDYI